jgi:hypothetical protein
MVRRKIPFARGQGLRHRRGAAGLGRAAGGRVGKRDRRADAARVGRAPARARVRAHPDERERAPGPARRGWSSPG